MLKIDNLVPISTTRSSGSSTIDPSIHFPSPYHSVSIEHRHVLSWAGCHTLPLWPPWLILLFLESIMQTFLLLAPFFGHSLSLWFMSPHGWGWAGALGGSGKDITPRGGGVHSALGGAQFRKSKMVQKITQLCHIWYIFFIISCIFGLFHIFVGQPSQYLK